MRIAVFSDSHNDIETMRQATARVMPDRIFHLGDMVSDAKALKIAFPDIPVYQVAGNNDYGREAEDTLEVELCGKRMVLTHGHLFSVEGGTAELRQYAASKKCTIALFGHTHEAFARLRHGVWLLNPGRVGPAYAVALCGDVRGVDAGRRRGALGVGRNTGKQRIKAAFRT